MDRSARPESTTSTAVGDGSVSYSWLAEVVGRFVDAWERVLGQTTTTPHGGAFDGASPSRDSLAGGADPAGGAGAPTRVPAEGQAGEKEPNLAAFLPQSEADRRLAAVELIKVDLEYRWGGGGAPRRVSEYVAEFAELFPDGPPIDLLHEEFHLRRQSGLELDPEEYLAEYPEQAERLRPWLSGSAGEVSTVRSRPENLKLLESVEAGQTIDDFDLLLQLGRGAFARVFLARQRSMQRMVALKVSADRGTEPQTLAQLDHDAIVRVFDQHRLPQSGLRLLYMQYLAGGTLQAAVRRVQSVGRSATTGTLLLDVVDEALSAKGDTRPTESAVRKRLERLSWPEAVAWLGARLAEGLDYAHRRGVLHRDIKPANVLLSAEGAPKLADFNISFSSQIGGTTPAAYFGGSLAYMSPEQLEACHPGRSRQADDLDGRSDIYSLGVMLWELLTGRRPFVDDVSQAGWMTSVETMLSCRSQGVTAEQLRESCVDCPRTLLRVLERCLAADRDQRWQTAGELASQLEVCLDPRARALLDPAPESWAVRLRRFAVSVVLVANLIPNLLASIYNFHDNNSHIVQHLPQTAQKKFEFLVAATNGTAFPVGIFAIIWLARRARPPIRLAAGTRSTPSGGDTDPGPPAFDADPAISDDEIRTRRRACLRLGERSAMVCLVLWTFAGITYPLVLHSLTLSLTASQATYFVGSLVISGLISVTYPFFAVTCFCVRSLYPAYLQRLSPGAEDEAELLRLAHRLGPFLVLAGSVPLLAIGGLTLAAATGTPGAGLIVGSLCVGGILGLSVVYSLFRILQADLEALLRVVRRVP